MISLKEQQFIEQTQKFHEYNLNYFKCAEKLGIQSYLKTCEFKKQFSTKVIFKIDKENTF